MADPDELEIFDSKPLQDLIDFKWDAYAYKIHYVGVFMHIFYVLMIAIYIYTTYLHGTYGQ